MQSLLFGCRQTRAMGPEADIRFHTNTHVHKLKHAPTQTGTHFRPEPNREVFFVTKDIFDNSEGPALEFDKMHRKLVTSCLQD